MARNLLLTHMNSFRVAILAAAATLALCGSSCCRASCGGYVYSRLHTPAQHGSSQSQHAEADKLNAANSEILHSGNRDSDLPDSMPVQPMPCHGPNCSQNPTPLVPIAPPTSAAGSNQDRLMIGLLSFELAANSSSLEDVQSHARKRRGFPLLIEMPPEIVG